MLHATYCMLLVIWSLSDGPFQKLRRVQALQCTCAGLRVEDLKAVSAVVADMRKIIRQDPRIIQKLHRRVFLDKITREQVTLYVSFYVEAANRDAFMAIKQDLFLAFVDCVERNGAKLAKQRVQVLSGVHAVHVHLSRSAPDVFSNNAFHRIGTFHILLDTAGVCTQCARYVACRLPRRQQARLASACGRCSHWHLSRPSSPQRRRSGCASERDARQSTVDAGERHCGFSGGRGCSSCSQGGSQS